MVDSLDIEKKEEQVSHVESAPQGYQFAHIDPDVQKRVVRKMDRNIIPLVVALCRFWAFSHPLLIGIRKVILIVLLRLGIVPRSQ
jgi:hypothetical protein